jgi:hypothetical protein
LVSFHVRNKVPVYIMVVALVTSLAAVLLGQLDSVAFDPIDCADVTPAELICVPRVAVA